MKTKISRRGNDEGYALMASLALVFILALLFLPLAQYATLRERAARRAMDRAVEDIRDRNAAVAGKYEFD